ncbi:hypothetical protein FRB90_005206, partial [Tulasnella sp. 427]
MADQVPEEVWHKILVYLRDREDDHWQDLDDPRWQNRSTLLPLLPTCRFLHNIAEPLLYENGIVYLGPRSSTCSTLLDALEGKEERRGWVKTLVATSRKAQALSSFDSDSIIVHSTSVEKALQLAPRLQGLHLDATTITKELHYRIFGHPTLHAVVLQDCNLSGMLVHPSSLIGSKVTDITLYQTSFEVGPFLREASRLCSLPCLMDLTISAPFAIHITALVRRLPPPQFPGLRRLAIHLAEEHPDTWGKNGLRLSPLLDHTPNITQLVLEGKTSVYVLVDPASSLPHLKILRAPVEAVKVLKDIGELESLTVDRATNHPRMFPLGHSILYLSMDVPLEAVADL